MKLDLSTSENPDDVESWPNALPRRNEAVFLAVCVVSAFVIRFLLIPQDSTIKGDGIYYATLGREIMLGNLSEGISAYWAPLYSILIGISSLFFQDLEFAGRFVSVVAGTLLIIPSYFLIQKFYGRIPAYIGTILVVIQPSLIMSSVWVMTESLYALIFTTVVLTGWLALKSGKGRSFFFTGLLFGAAYLTKPEALGFVVLFAALMLGGKFFCNNIGYRRLTINYLMLFIGLAIFVVPYVVFIHQKTGNWTISQKLLSNVPAVESNKGLLKLTDDGETTMRDRLFLDGYNTKGQTSKISQAIDPATANAPAAELDYKHLISKTFDQLYRQLREHIPAILPYFFIFLAGFGFFFKSWAMRRTAEEVYLFLFVACTFIGYAATVIELRYLYTIIPILMAWVAYGSVAFSGVITKTGSHFLKAGWKIKPVFVQVFILLILTVSLKALFLGQFGPPQLEDMPFEEKQAGLWLKNHAEPNSLVMASNATVAFYAGAKLIFLPDEEFSTILEYARRKKVNYVVLSERRLKNIPNAFRLAEEYCSKELSLVYQEEQAPNYKIRIYQMVN